MDTVTRRMWGAGALTAIIFATQSHHFMSLYHFPPAAFAAMFLGGFLLRRLGWFLYLLSVIVMVDALTIGLGGAPGAYFAWSYLFMIPAYGVLWFSGSWAQQRQGASYLLNLFYVLFGALSIVLAELISSGSFYYLKTIEPHSLQGLVNYFDTWAYQSIESFVFWLVPGLTVYYFAKAAQNLIERQHIEKS